MSARKSVRFLLEGVLLSQSESESGSGDSKALRSNSLTSKTHKPRIDLLEALISVYSTLNLEQLISVQGDIWNGRRVRMLAPKPHKPSKKTISTRTRTRRRYRRIRILFHI